MTKYESTSEIWHQRAPARRADVGADVAVPLLQSLVTGLIAGAIGVILVNWKTGLIAFVLFFGLAWLLLLADHRRLLWRIESMTGYDLDRNGATGQPEPGWITINGERSRASAALTEAQKKREAILRLVKIIWIRQQLNRPTGQKALRGHTLPHGYQITDELHKEVGEKLIASGFARRNGKGWDLIAAPEEIDQAINTW